MTKYLILLAILLALYLYWKHQQNKTLPKPDDKPDDIIERKGKAKSETFWEAQDWEINSDNEGKDNTIFGPDSVKFPSAESVSVTKRDNLGNLNPEEVKPILSHKQHRQLKKKK